MLSSQKVKPLRSVPFLINMLFYAGQWVKEAENIHPDLRGRSKIIFADDMILCIKNPEESTKTVLEVESRYAVSF